MIGIFLISALIITIALFLNRNKEINYGLIAVYIILICGFTLYEFLNKNISELTYFKPDSLAILMMFTMCLVSIPSFYHSYIYFVKNNKDNPRERAIYYSATIVLLTAVTSVYLSDHIAVTWIFIEVTTLSASALIYHRRNNRSLEGTWKYVFVCAISISLVFIGILFLSFAVQQAGSSDLSYASLIEKANILNPFWLKLAFIFIFTGYTAKLGLVPMYTAGIDAKDKAPSPAGALLSSVLINAGFVAVFRVYVIMANTSLHIWTNHILLIAAVLTIFVATVYMFKVKNIKRLLAYSSIEHMGIVMLGIVAGGIGYYAAILQLILHSLVKSGMFFQSGTIYRVYQSKSVYDMGYYFRYNVTGAILFFLSFIFIVAIPPSGLFLSELYIFKALFSTQHYIVLVLTLLLVTMIIWAFGKSVFSILFSNPIGFDDSRVEKISPVESFSQIILLFFVVYLGFNPPSEFVLLILESIQNLPK